MDLKTEVVSTIKSGQIHLNYSGEAQTLFAFFETYKKQLISSVDELSQSMIKRGGGLIDLSLTNESESLSDYYYIDARFNTADAMGAKLISIHALRRLPKPLGFLASNFGGFGQGEQPEVVMSILSNFVPECLVRVTVRCPVSELAQEGLSGKEFCA